jgi:hypothetical protein
MTHPLDKLISRLERTKPGYINEKDLALVHAAYVALSDLIREGSLELDTLLASAGIDKGSLGETTSALFAIQCFLDLNTRR